MKTLDQRKLEYSIKKRQQGYKPKPTQKDVQQAKRFAYSMVVIIFLFIALMVFLIGGVDGLKMWLTPKGIK